MTKGDALNDVETIISQLEEQKGAIDRAILALRGISGPASAPVKKIIRPPGRTAKAAGAKTAKATTKRRLSAEGRERIIEALRKRWTAKRAAGKKSEAKKRVKKAAHQPPPSE